MPRFFRPPPWRLVVTDRQSVAITLLDRLASDRKATYELNAPAQFEATVPASTPEVNLVHTDGFATGGAGWIPEYDVFDLQGPGGGGDNYYPFLAEGVRFLYCLRGVDAANPAPYEPVFSGAILQISDHGSADRTLTSFTAFDPWKLLERRPCTLRLEVDPGNVDARPGSWGTKFVAETPVTEVALELLKRTIGRHGTVHIDAGDGSRSGEGAQYADWGGTSFYDGTIEDCGTLAEPMVFQKGTTVADAWRQLTDTGKIDIVLKPIYDPANRPGYLVEFNAFKAVRAAGDYGYGQVVTTFLPTIAFDRSGHGVREISVERDGTERANMLALAGSLKLEHGLLDNQDSIDRFGQSWEEESLVRVTSNENLDATAQREMRRRMKGRRTWRLAPTPEIELIPFRDFHLGWTICLYNSRRLREITNDCFRVLGFSIEIGDDLAENVSELLFGDEETS